MKTALTTPEAPDLHALFALMREREVAACAMEVSSHALVMGRVDGVVFDVAVFLNLGRDHLDFHADEEDYYRAKASLFTPERARLALVGVDDEHGRRLAGETDAAGAHLLHRRPRTRTGRSADVGPGPDGTTFRVLGPGVDVEAGVPLPGGFNVSQRAGRGRGLRRGRARRRRGRGGRSPRAAECPAGSSGSTPASRSRSSSTTRTSRTPSQAALESLRPLTDGRLIVVLGAGGDRDPGKRPIMGEIAARLADVVVVTDDNPRTEDPAAIRAAVLEGARAGTAPRCSRRATDGPPSPPRSGWPRPGDIVVVAGKGHETGQEVDGVVHPFDDREVVRELLAARSPSGARPYGNRVHGGPRRTRGRRTESWPSGPGPTGRGGR